MRTTTRAVVLLALCSLLVGAFVGYGAISPDPSENRFPGSEAVVLGDVDAGERVVVGGEVVEVRDGHVGDGGERAGDGDDTYLLEVETDHGTYHQTVRNVDGASVGDLVSVYGTVADDGAIDAERSVIRAHWEIVYMYAVSLVAALWVAGRFVRRWRFDRGRWGFVPGDRRG